MVAIVITCVLSKGCMEEEKRVEHEACNSVQFSITHTIHCVGVNGDETEWTVSPSHPSSEWLVTLCSSTINMIPRYPEHVAHELKILYMCFSRILNSSPIIPHMKNSKSQATVAYINKAQKVIH
jgi:hypothetical protein